jgi:8-oxo-dGTP pyrophosphatase MutT (NUDIX family)
MAREARIARERQASIKMKTKSGKAPKPRDARVQYAALPFRSSPEPEVLLVSSRETKRWVIPKGWPMKGRKPHAAAAQEALEEAGLLGKIEKKPVGSYHYVKNMRNGAAILCRVDVFPLQVARQRKSWPERDQRVTRWFSLAQAAEAVREPELADIIREFTPDRSSQDGKVPNAREASQHPAADTNPKDAAPKPVSA